MYIKIKILKEQKDSLISSTFHIETYDKNFVNELKKYICPFRLTMFLTEKENKEYTPLKKSLSENQYSLIIDLSSKTNQIINKKIEAGELLSIILETYIKSTSHLDKYGYKILNDEIMDI